MRVLLTGASGFLGRHLAAAFTARGDEVTAVVRPQSDTAPLQQLGIRLATATLEQSDRLADAMRGVDAVVHGIAKVHTHGPWSEFREVTVEGTRRVLAAATAANVPHFLHLSSVGVYGWPRPDGRPFTETDQTGHIYRWNYYSRAKHLAEEHIRQSALPFTIFRPTLIYGPGDTGTLGRIVSALRAGKLKIIGPGDNRLSLIYVSDVVDAVVAAAHTPASRGEIYNVAADETCLTQYEFLAALCRLTGTPLPAQHVGFTTAHRLAFLSECVAHATRFAVCPPLTRLAVLLLGGRRAYASDKLRQQLGWQPRVAMPEGLARSV